MRSKILIFSLLLITLLTKPKSWVITGASILVLTMMKLFFEGQSIFLKSWREIWSGMTNPDIELEQKVFVLISFIVVTGLATCYTKAFKLLVMHKYKRFYSKKWLTRPGTATLFPLRLRLPYKAARAGGVSSHSIWRCSQ